MQAVAESVNVSVIPWASEKPPSWVVAKLTEPPGAGVSPPSVTSAALIGSTFQWLRWPPSTKLIVYCGAVLLDVDVGRDEHARRHATRQGDRRVLQEVEQDRRDGARRRIPVEMGRVGVPVEGQREVLVRARCAGI